MAVTRILLAEDDSSIVENLTAFLESEGFSVCSVRGQAEAIERLSQEEFDLLLLDVSLADGNGYAVCTAARARSDIAVIFLTASDDEYSVVTGLEMGADDYIVKPFEPKELIARIKAVIRRFQVAEAPEKELVFPGLTINISQYTVTYMGKPLEMPPREIELLYFLASHPGMVFTREQLLEQVWGYDYFGDSRTVDVHVKRLREKLSGGEELGWQIKTVWGVGYKFEVK